MRMIEYISHSHVDGGSGLLGIIFRAASVLPKGVHFFTDQDLHLQLGVIEREAGDEIAPHEHPPQDMVRYSRPAEVLIVQSGRIAVTFFSYSRELVETKELGLGDAVILLRGGHSVKFMEDSRVIEVRSGPFVPESKIRWNDEGDR